MPVLDESTFPLLDARTAERGWANEIHQRTDKGPRYIDNGKESRLRGAEFKAGKVGKDALLQLDKDEMLMERGWSLEWYLAPNSRVDKEVAARMQALQARFPDQFQVIRVSREQFAQAIESGKEIAQQREAQQHAKQQHKAVEKRQAVERQKVSLVKAAPEKARQVEQTKPAVKATESEREKVARDAADRVAREFVAPTQMPVRTPADKAAPSRGTPATAQELAAREVAENVAREFADQFNIGSARTVPDKTERDRGETDRQHEIEKTRRAQEYAERRRAAELALLPRTWPRRTSSGKPNHRKRQ